MSATIQGLAVKLTANVAGFASGMLSATRPLGSFTSSVASASAKLGGMFSIISGFVSAGALVYLTKQSMDSIDSTAKLSDRLGIATEKLIGLQHGAELSGISAESLAGGLEKMLNTMSDAATKGGAAAAAFRTLGLDAGELAALTPDEAFARIADSLVAVENPAQRAALAMDVFGKAGQGLLPLMLQGSEGIKAAQAEAEKLGLTFSRVDAAKVEAANDAMTRLTKVFTGAFQSLAIQVAPFVEAAATKLTELATSGEGVGGRVVKAFEWVVSGVAYLSDYLSLAKAGFKLLQAGATYAVFGVVKAVDFLGDKIVGLLNLLPGVEMEWTSFTGELADGLLDEAKQLQAEAGEAFTSFADGENAKKVGRFFGNIRSASAAAAEQLVADAPKMTGALRQLEDDADRLKKVSDALEQIQKDAAQFGLSDSQKKLADLSALGATPEQLADAQRLLNLKSDLESIGSIDTGDPLTDLASKMERLQKLYAAGKVSVEQFQSIRDQAHATLGEKLAHQAKAVVESVKSPLDSYNDELAKLRTLLDRGLITQDVFDKATAKAKSALESATASIEIKAPQAVRASSAEAQRLAYESARGVQRTMGKDEVAKKSLATQEDMAATLASIDRNIRNGNSAPVEVVDF